VRQYCAGAGSSSDLAHWRVVCDFRRPEAAMLYYALVFLVLAIIAGIFGFGGIMLASAGIAKILFIVFLVGLVISALWGFTKRPI
jgi:uncharacterized membrane protein YtjA (UPF0391 family)